jgi:hypothetical protein
MTMTSTDFYSRQTVRWLGRKACHQVDDNLQDNIRQSLAAFGVTDAVWTAFGSDDSRETSGGANAVKFRVRAPKAA